MIELQSTINNGLPVLVRGTVTKCGPREYPGRDYSDDMEVLWMSGKPCNLDLTPEDDRRLSDELFEAATTSRRVITRRRNYATTKTRMEGAAFPGSCKSRRARHR